MARKLAIDWSDLQMAFEAASEEAEYYLDRETGAVVMVTEDLRRELEEDVEPEASDFGAEALELARAVAEDPKPYLPIPEQDSHEGYRDMEEFIGTVPDAELARLLKVAIQGRGAFRRFKDVLGDYPAERERWFAWQDRRLQGRILEWLEAQGITPAQVPEPRQVPQPSEVPEPREASAVARDDLLADLTLLTLYLSSWQESAGGIPVHRAWKGHRWEVLDALESPPA